MRRRAAAKSWFFLLSSVLGLAGGLLTAPLTARALGVEDRGRLGVLLAVQMLWLPLSGLGVPSQIRRLAFTDFPAAVGALGKARRQAISMAPISGLLGLCVGLALGLGAPILMAIALLFMMSNLEVYRLATSSLLLARGRTGSVALQTALPPVVTLCSLPLLYALGRLTLTTALVAVSVGFLMQFPVGYRLVRREVLALPSGRTTPVRPDFGLTALQLCELGLRRIDVVVVGVVAGTAAAGFYTIAIIPCTISTAAATSVLGLLLARHDLDVTRRLLAAFRAARAITAVVWAVCAVPFALAIPLVFGSEFDSSRHWLLPSMVVAFGLAGVLPAIQTSVLGLGTVRPLRLSLFLLGPALPAMGLAAVSAELGPVVLGLCWIGTGLWFELTLTRSATSVGSGLVLVLRLLTGADQPIGAAGEPVPAAAFADTSTCLSADRLVPEAEPLVRS